MKSQRWPLALFLTTALAVVGFAQKPPSPPVPPAGPATPSAKSAEAPAEVAPDTAVITLDGVCRAKDPKTGDCRTAITRAQFDKLLNALGAARPGHPLQLPPAEKRRFATQYARTLFFATEAEKEGLLDRPEARELLHFARLQVAEQEMRRELQEKAQPTPDEIQKYYDANLQRFTELTLDRILIPLRKAEGGMADAGERQKLADDLRQRAVAGADFKTLQKEAFEKAGLQNPPETTMVMRSTTLPPSQQSVLQLKPGEISPVVQDPSGLYIYKLESKRPLPLDGVKQEIQNTLTGQKVQQEMEAFTHSMNPVLNPQYFGPPPAVGAGPQHMPGAAIPPVQKAPGAAAPASGTAPSAEQPGKAPQSQPQTPAPVHP